MRSMTPPATRLPRALAPDWAISLATASAVSTTSIGCPPVAGSVDLDRLSAAADFAGEARKGVRPRGVCNARSMGRGGGSDERVVATTNRKRVEWARAALGAYAPLVYGKALAELHPDDLATCVTDVVADLVHFSRHEGID